MREQTSWHWLSHACPEEEQADRTRQPGLLLGPGSRRRADEWRECARRESRWSLVSSLSWGVFLKAGRTFWLCSGTRLDQSESRLGQSHLFRSRSIATPRPPRPARRSLSFYSHLVRVTLVLSTTRFSSFISRDPQSTTDHRLCPRRHGQNQPHRASGAQDSAQPVR